ncbi:8969_t:CDS:2, partial [Ambispora leptoticha]
MILFKSTIFRKNISQKTRLKINNIRRAKIHYPKPLPYEYQDGLPPLFTQKALHVIYNEYHLNLIRKLNELAGAEFEESSVIDIIEKTAQVPSQAVLFNYASQTFNNDFFLQTLV